MAKPPFTTYSELSAPSHCLSEAAKQVKPPQTKIAKELGGSDGAKRVAVNLVFFFDYA